MHAPEGVNGMLTPYRVLDMSDEKALMCGKVLGCLGADVIKIERPGGDRARNIGPFYKDQVHPEKSLYWFYMNTSKRGITLDITKADGKELFRNLVKTADIVVESFEPGYMASLGLGYEDLCQVKPDIIMTSVSPFGQTGPHADFKHSDLTTWAMGGHMSLTGVPEREPIGCYLHQANFHGGLHAATASLIALTHRINTGEGQHVDVSIQQAVILTLMIAAEYWDVIKTIQQRVGHIWVLPRPDPAGPLEIPRAWPCKDGHLIGLLLGGTEGFIAASTAITQWALSEGYMQDIKDFDWHSFDAMGLSQEMQNRIKTAAIEFFMTKTKQEIMDRSAAQSLQFSPVNNMEDIYKSPHYRARGFWDQIVEHPELDDAFAYPGPPVKASEAPWRVWSRAPLIGEHNEDIYAGELGLSKEQMAILKANEII
jgi:benzylsuccinate CoA-transferase BbsE subunit